MSVRELSTTTRLLVWAFLVVAVGALGSFAQSFQWREEVATMTACAITFTLGFYFQRRPETMAQRLGPFAPVANALRHSAEDIRVWIGQRERVLVFLLGFFGYGLLIVLLKAAALAVFKAFENPALLVLAAAVSGAAVVLAGRVQLPRRKVGQEVTP